jgi:ketosteroid isomerase-like protein
MRLFAHPMLRRISCTLAGSALLASCASRPAASAPSRADLTAEVTAMFARSASAWNRGDLDTFMTDYLPGDRTTYVASKGVIHGPAAIRERYAPRFAPGGMHDSLSFEGIEVDPLAPDVINVIAWYVLMRGDSLVARGPTSLVMVRQDGRLRIVHDHSS